jgi:hypothetical protein
MATKFLITGALKSNETECVRTTEVWNAVHGGMVARRLQNLLDRL